MAEDAPDTQVDDAPDQQEAPDQEPKAKAGAPEPKGDKSGKSNQKEAPGKGPSPWEKGLDEALNSDDPRTALDAMFRESQGYTTSKEQELAEYSNLFARYGEEAPQMAAVGAGILEALDADPAQGMAQLVTALLSEGDLDAEEIYEAIAEAFDGHIDFDAEYDDEEYEEGDEEYDDEEGEYEEELPEDPRLQFVDEMISEREQQEAETAYDTLKQGIEEAIGEGFDSNRFDQLVVVHQGDVESALQDYTENWHRAPEPTPDPPPTPGQGGKGRGASAPKAQQKYGSFGEAADSMLAEING